MVRLKAGIENGTDKAKALFQFHYGAIKGEEETTSYGGAICISIPLWCD